MIELLRSRRSIRKYTAEAIPPEFVAIIIEAALRSPSSRGLNPWEFILVDEPDALARLGKAKRHGSAFFEKAPLAVVVCADSTKSDVWIEDCAIAAILIQFTAHSLGLGSCWAQIRNRPHDSGQSAEQYVRGLLDLPEQINVEAIIGIGYPAEVKRPVSHETLQFEKVRRNRWL